MEIIILVFLTAALVGGVWVTHKLSLVNYDSAFDRTKVKTSSEAKKQKKSTGTKTAEEETDDDSSVKKITPIVTGQPDWDEDLEIPESNFKGIDMIALVGLDTRPLEEDEDTGDNSDTMIICCINHNTKTVKLVSIYRDTLMNIGENWDGTKDTYYKANAAYNIGGPEQFLSMINLNLDLDVTEYVTVQFKALATAIEMLGGLDVDLTYQEIVHLNNYNIETSAACDMEYVEIELPSLDELNGIMTKTYHLNGSQAVSYARIRYTDGFDFRRASRQRLILSLLKEKAKHADLGTINKLLEAVLPMVTTNIDSSKILQMAWPVLFYTMTDEDQAGFPFVHLEDDGVLTGDDCIIPVTLEYNVTRLHEMLFPDVEYWPSWIVQEYSDKITKMTGFGEETIEAASEIPDDAAIPKYDPALVEAELEASREESEWYEANGYYFDEELQEWILAE